MFVITLDSPPQHLPGTLARWLTEIAPNVFVGDYGRGVRDDIWLLVQDEIGTGSARIAWSWPSEAGFRLASAGAPPARPEVNNAGLLLTALSGQP